MFIQVQSLKKSTELPFIIILNTKNIIILKSNCRKPFPSLSPSRQNIISRLFTVLFIIVSKQTVSKQTLNFVYFMISQPHKAIAAKFVVCSEIYNNSIWNKKKINFPKLSHAIIQRKVFDNFKRLQRKLNQFSIKYKIFCSIEVNVKLINFF